MITRKQGNCKLSLKGVTMSNSEDEDVKHTPKNEDVFQIIIIIISSQIHNKEILAERKKPCQSEKIAKTPTPSKSKFPIYWRHFRTSEFGVCK